MFKRSPKHALLHFEVGVQIAELSLSPGFVGLLPWGCIYNRPYLRCLHGYGLCLWRLGRFPEAPNTSSSGSSRSTRTTTRASGSAGAMFGMGDHGKTARNTRRELTQLCKLSLPGVMASTDQSVDRHHHRRIGSSSASVRLPKHDHLASCDGCVATAKSARFRLSGVRIQTERR
jgi:hypothetical protein